MRISHWQMCHFSCLNLPSTIFYFSSHSITQFSIYNFTLFFFVATFDYFTRLTKTSVYFVNFYSRKNCSTKVFVCMCVNEYNSNNLPFQYICFVSVISLSFDIRKERYLFVLWLYKQSLLRLDPLWVFLSLYNYVNLRGFVDEKFFIFFLAWWLRKFSNKTTMIYIFFRFASDHQTKNSISR